MNRHIPHSARMWIENHRDRLDELRETRAADRLALEEFSDEYYKLFGRDLGHDKRLLDAIALSQAF